MPNLSPQDANQFFGGSVPDAQQAANTYVNGPGGPDPLKLWWDTFINGTGGPAQAIQASGGGPHPTRGFNEAGALAGSFGMNPDIRNAAALDAIMRAGANQGPRGNPYNAGIADQSRGAQLALLAQMRAMQQGPSLAALQTQRALAQSGQSALAAAAMGAPGRAAMMQAGQVGGGLAGDAGQARLAEVMRMQAAQGGLAGGLRGNDLNSAGYQSQNGLAAARQDEALRQMYAQAGMNLQNARDQALTNRQVTYYQLLAKKNAQDMDLVNKTMQSGAGLMGTAATAGGKK